MPDIFSIEKPWGPSPGIVAHQDEDDAFRDRQDYYIIAQTAILNATDNEIRGFWENTDSNEIISDLKEIYELQVLLMKHDCLDEFPSCKMEEHTTRYI
jgi:hypothetical protein